MLSFHRVECFCDVHQVLFCNNRRTIVTMDCYHRETTVFRSWSCSYAVPHWNIVETSINAALTRLGQLFDIIVLPDGITLWCHPNGLLANKVVMSSFSRRGRHGSSLLVSGMLLAQEKPQNWMIRQKKRACGGWSQLQRGRIIQSMVLFRG